MNETPYREYDRLIEPHNEAPKLMSLFNTSPAVEAFRGPHGLALVKSHHGTAVGDSSTRSYNMTPDVVGTLDLRYK